MRIFKSHPLLKLVNSYIIDSPQPSNLSYLWNFGSLLAFCLVIQIITGVTLAMHYNPSVLEAFNSVEHIMRDVNNGWLIRYLHSNTASAFFFLVYLHMGRGLYYGSYRSPRTLVWTLGTIIFLLMIVTAFLGFLNIAQNGFNSILQQQQQQQQQYLQYGFITHNLQSSLISLVFIYKAFNVIKIILLVLVLLLLIVISLAFSEDNRNSPTWDYGKDLPLRDINEVKSNSDSSTYEKLIKVISDNNKLDKSFSTSNKRHYSTIFMLGKRHYSTISMLGKRYYSIKDYSNTSKILKDFISEKNLEPVYIYENLRDSSTKKKLLEDTRGLSGIYLILNKVTMDYYIGSASTNRINARFSNHLIHLTGSKVLKNAVRKYKISQFAFLVLELFPEIVTQENNTKLLNLEDFYLKSLLPNYNILTEAGSSFGYKHSELTRIKMKTNYSQERRDKIANLTKNKKFSTATISLMKEKALNRVKPIYSEQAL